MQFRKIQILQTFLFLFLGVILVYFQLNRLSPEQKQAAFAAVKNVNLFWISLAVIASFLGNWLRAKRWKLVIDSTHFTASIFYATCAVFIGYFVNSFIPRGGEIGRCVALSKTDHVPVETLLGTVIAERIIDFITMILIIFFTIVTQYDVLFDALNESFFIPLLEYIHQLYTHKIYFWLGSFLIILVLLFFGVFFIQLIKQSKLWIRIKDTWEKIKDNFLEGLQAITQLKQKAKFLFFTALLWLDYFMIAIFVFQSIPASKHLGFNAGLSVLTTGSLALLLPTPGGLGSYHQFVSSTLQLYQISEVIGVSLSWLIWICNYFVVFFFGIISFFIVSLKK